jgi:hypothetical protein
METKENKNLKELFDEYLSYCQFQRCLSPETIRGYGGIFDTFSKRMPEIKDAQGLIPEMMSEFFKRVKTRTRIVGKDTEKTGVKKSSLQQKLICYRISK